MIDIAELPSRAVARVVDSRDEPDFDVQRLVEAAKSAEEKFAIRRGQKLKASAQLKNGSKWVLALAVTAHH